MFSNMYLLFWFEAEIVTLALTSAELSEKLF